MNAIAFSVVIPSFRRPQRLAACLASLAASDFPRRDFEVIVVDDAGGEAPLDPVVAAHCGGGLQLRLIVQAHAGPARARNTGAAAARGRYLAFTDDDCSPDPGWLSALEAGFRAHPDAALGGHTRNAEGKNPFSSASQLLIDYLYAYYNRDPWRARFFASNNLAVPKLAFRDAGAFDPGFPRAAGEDREFCDRWLWQGRRLVYVPEAGVFHSHPLSLFGFVRQHFDYGRGARLFRKVRARRTREPVMLEPLSFYLGLPRAGFGREHPARALELAALLALSQLANGAGFAWQKASEGVQEAVPREV